MSTFFPFSHTTGRLRSSANSGRKDALLDATGQILGLLASDGHYLPSTTLQSVLESIRNDQLEAMRFRDFDARRLPQSAAFRQGFDLKWSVSMWDQQILSVHRVPAKCVDGQDHPLRRGDEIQSKSFYFFLEHHKRNRYSYNCGGSSLGTSVSKNSQ